MAGLRTDAPVGVVGSGSLATRVVETLQSMDRTVVTGGVEAVIGNEVGLIISTEPAALHAVIQGPTGVPVLPLGVESPPIEATDAMTRVRTAIEQGWTNVSQSILTVEADGNSSPVVYEVTVMTDEPARISEYTISDTPPDTPDSVRADGVVIATPEGSTGYAHAAGGPPVSADSDTVAVVPVAPFAVDRRPWVTTPPITITVQRDEGAVSVYTDGDRLGPVDRGQTVRIDWGGETQIARLLTPDEKT